MSEKKDEAREYVQKVLTETRSYVQELLTENERLRGRLVGAESSLEGLENDKSRLKEQLSESQQDLERHLEEHTRLQNRLSEIETENRTYSEQYVKVEQQNTNLAYLYVASYRLHSTMDREEVLAALGDIIVNLIGSEEFAIFGTDSGTGELQRIFSIGIDSGLWESVPEEPSLVRRCVQSGEILVVSDKERQAAVVPDEKHLTACIPLQVDERLIGVVAIFRLLPQKGNGLEDLDREILNFLATQAGSAIHFTSLVDPGTLASGEASDA